MTISYFNEVLERRDEIYTLGQDEEDYMDQAQSLGRRNSADPIGLANLGSHDQLIAIINLKYTWQFLVIGN